MDALQTPVLVIAYRRAETTRQVIDSLRGLRPERLYFAANGPDPARPDDPAQCESARGVLGEVDWPCEIRRLFRTEHLPARESIARAIDWFFEHETEGVILEDDCICAPAFFRMAQELLIRYRDRTEVMQIGATNFAPHLTGGGDSYSFSGYAYIWGWATWRRAWRLFDLQMSTFDEASVRAILRSRFPRWRDRSFWLAMYRYLSSGRLDTWDVQWNFALFRANGLSVVPRVNLVRNIGFGAQSTNTTNAQNAFASMAPGELAFPLKHPERLQAAERADDWVSDHVFGATRSVATLHAKMRIASMLTPSWKRRLKRMLGL